MAATDPLKYLRPDLADLEDYTPSKPLEVLAEEIGVPMDRIVKLDANESMYPVPQAVIDEMARANLHIYSDPSQNALRSAIASYTGFPDDWIVAGCGGDDIIEITMKVVKPESIIVTSPTFSMYAFIAKIHRIKVVDVPRKLPHFDLDVDGIIAEIRKGSKLVYLISPNNPTGNLLPESELCRICEEDCMVAVDEAYVEFSPYSVAHLIHKYPNLVIIRTFSKWAGLAGLRIGYSISHPTVANWMNAVRLPFNVSIAGDVAAIAAIRHKDEIFQNVDKIKKEVVSLTERASETGFLRPLPSFTNFVLMEVQSWNAEMIALYLRKAGVFIRHYRSADLFNYLRISAGRPQDTQRVFEEIHNFVKFHEEQLRSVDTIIFDMDGVLADVSQSYRSAIIKTAESYGAIISSEDIVEAKNAGGANNDWLLTQRLMEKKGVTSVSLEEITDRFNLLYRGTPEKPGLYTTEKLLVSKRLLEVLSSKYKVGIVTGRPREECNIFLEMFDIGKYFQHCVCMEDAPLKPNPAPVNLCMQILGGTKAFMIGDTPDDMRAATSAGIYGFGIPAPGHGTNPSVLRYLYASGATKVLSNLDKDIPQILGISLD